jgi:Sec-independent protein translocase protein TatA
MRIQDIGLSELFFIVVLILVLISPKDMRKTGLVLGRWLNQFIHSPTWKAWQQIQRMPTELLRQANLEDLSKDIGSIVKQGTTEHDNLSSSKPSESSHP